MNLLFAPVVAPIVAAAAMLAAIPAPAAAATDPMLAARKVLSDYGACIVRREPDNARRYVLSGAFMDRRKPEDRNLVQRECIDTQKTQVMRVSNFLMKGAIAQALFDRDAAKLGTTFTGVPALTYEDPFPVRGTDRDGKALDPDALARQQGKYAEKLDEVQMARMGECVARADGAGTRAVIASPGGSQAELDALQRIAPFISPCIPAGVQLKMDRLGVRSALAIGYYRLAAGASGAAG